MSEMTASSDAHRIASVADLLGRLPEQLRNSPIFEQLALADEAAEADRLSCALREARQPELKGLGTSFRPTPMPAADATATSDRAEVVTEHSEPTVQRVVLHGENSVSEDYLPHRAAVGENRCFLGLDASAESENRRISGTETVQALSVKDSENNGCTEGSTSPSEGASPQASRDNFFSPPAHSAHEDNGPCTASAPPSPVQEIIARPQPGADLEGQCAPEEPLAKFALGYCRCDFFDNGPTTSSKSTKSGRGRARFKINVFIGPDKRGWKPFKLAFLSEARFFKRSAPVGNAGFYDTVWSRFEELRKCVRDERLPMEIAPILGHLKTTKNHVVPRAAAILFKEEGEAATIILFIEGSEFPIDLNQKAKGSAKCPALKALGYWKPEK